MADLKVALEELKEESDSGKLTPAPSVAQARNRTWIALGVSAALVLLSVAAAWLWWHSKPEKTAERRLTRLTSNGVSFNPSISPDGKLLAYLSSAGGPNPDIWVQQIGGGTAIQITHEKQGASSPVFSPDGTHIAHESHGRIYEVPALGGDPRLITVDGLGPRYTQDGSTMVWVRLLEGSFRLLMTPRLGGTPVAILPEIGLGSPPVVSPDGSKLLTLASRKGRQGQDLRRWWMISISGGLLEEIAPPPLLPSETQAPQPLAWITPERGSRYQWVVFGRSAGDTYNLFRVAIASDGKVTSDPEQLTFATGFATSPSISASRRMVFDSGIRSSFRHPGPAVDICRGDRHPLDQPRSGR
jgi:hypothetical protein